MATYLLPIALVNTHSHTLIHAAHMQTHTHAHATHSHMHACTHTTCTQPEMSWGNSPPPPPEKRGGRPDGVNGKQAGLGEGG